jgi:hypothetical protein
VPVENSPALPTAGLPFAFRHVRLAASHRLGSNLQTLLLPDSIMTVFRPDQRMSNLVQEGIDNLFGAVPQHEEDAQFDGTAVINAEAQSALAAVEAEGPVGQAVRSQESQSQLVDVLDSMTWADQPGRPLLKSCLLCGLFRGDGLCVLAQLIHSFCILQSCLVKRDVRWVDFDAVLLFDVRR